MYVHHFTQLSCVINKCDSEVVLHKRGACQQAAAHLEIGALLNHLFRDLLLPQRDKHVQNPHPHTYEMVCIYVVKYLE